MTGTEFVFLYSTLPDEDSALRIARVLVGAHLAACVNIHAPMQSVYEWQGALVTESEVPVFIKIRRKDVDAAIALARKSHPYSVPCFLTLPVDGGNDDYIAWARGQTRR